MKAKGWAVIAVAVLVLGSFGYVGYLKGKDRISDANWAETEGSRQNQQDAAEGDKENGASAKNLEETLDIDIPDSNLTEDNWQNTLNTVTGDGNGTDETSSQDESTIAITSGTGRHTVFVRWSESQILYIYDNDTKQLDSIEVTPLMATDIMSIEWLDDTKVAAFSHVNPSTGWLDIYDVETKENLAEKCCSRYTWTDGLETLVYVEPSPHFAQHKGWERVLNVKDEVLYRTEENEIIYGIAEKSDGDLAVLVVEKTENYETKGTKLLFLEKKGQKGNRYKVSGQKKLKTDAIDGLEWVNEKKVIYYVGKKKKKAVF